MKYMNSRTKIVLAGILLLAIMIPTALSINNGQGSSNVVTPSQQTNTQGMPGLVCFKYNDYGDTWVLSFRQTGPNEFLASGYDQIYPAAMTGGGAIVNGKLLLSLDERSYDLYGIGGNAQHNVVIDMATSPYSGSDRLTWFDIYGVKMISYQAGLALTEVACPTGAQPKIGTQKTSAGK
jgi:hypothetical protein